MSSTWAMDHVFLHNAMKLWICSGAWEFGRYGFVDVIWSDFAGRIQPDQDVDMWQASLLKFDGIQPTLWCTEGATLDEVHAFLQLEGEDTCDELWSILCLLSWQQVCCDFIPFGIGGHGDEEVRASMLTDVGHRVQLPLMNVARATVKSRGQYDTLSDIAWIVISCEKSVAQVTVAVGTEL